MKSTIPLQPCDSSRICAHGYDANTGTLALQFKGKDGPGPVYHYANVTPEIHQQWAAAESKGKFFGSVLNKPVNHPYTKMVDEEEQAA